MLARERLESGSHGDEAERADLRTLIGEGEAAFRHLVAANLRLVVAVASRAPRTRRAAPRSRAGGCDRSDPRGREVRPPQGLRLLHVRDLVDPAVGQPGGRRAVAAGADPRARARRRTGMRTRTRPDRRPHRTRAVGAAGRAGQRDRRRAGAGAAARRRPGHVAAAARSAAARSRVPCRPSPSTRSSGWPPTTCASTWRPRCSCSPSCTATSWPRGSGGATAGPAACAPSPRSRGLGRDVVQRLETEALALLRAMPLVGPLTGWLDV